MKNHTNFSNATRDELFTIRSVLYCDSTREGSTHEELLHTDERVTDTEGHLSIVCNRDGLCGVIVEDSEGYWFVPVSVES